MPNSAAERRRLMHAAAEAAGAPSELLGEYLALLEQASRSGKRATPEDLEAIRRLGGRTVAPTGSPARTRRPARLSR